ncbi:hypothetical protein J1605_019078 [Eschrichtius robustus]|uniref:Uncharacterized protein n=1 Tax=Eschrichtius robustus TaxID=9764 RepID=A0AB34HQX8_ESCRO|nr:hypothetical protein J1605_019078 [Eschrichtius robustus]
MGVRIVGQGRDCAIIITYCCTQGNALHHVERGHGFEPWSGKIPHASEQLSLCATTTEPVLQSPRGTTPEAQAPRACALQQEKPPQ